MSGADGTQPGHPYPRVGAPSATEPTGGTVEGVTEDLTGLALAARDGDEEALTVLIRHTQADVWRLCAHLAGRHRADDLTQETFIRAWRALPRYEARASVRTWLLAIAHNTAVDALRAARRRPETTAWPEDGAGLDVAPVADPAGVVTAEQLLAGLDPDRRLALFLTQLLGLSYAQAADICSVPVGTIRSRVSRGRQDLAQRLDIEATS